MPMQVLSGYFSASHRGSQFSLVRCLKIRFASVVILGWRQTTKGLGLLARCHPPVAKTWWRLEGFSSYPSMPMSLTVPFLASSRSSPNLSSASCHDMALEMSG